MSAPRVTILDPPEDLPREHHGPYKPPTLSLSWSSDKPQYFKNPWPSYRMPSLSDAWTAYQKGAAVALPPRKSRKWHREEGDGDSSETDEEEAPLVDANGAVRGEPGYILPGIYVRPELAKIQREDEEEDWRDPPVDVVSPTWGEGKEAKENVTWLGHAGVLVRIPWKKNVEGRQGMCGVLFDPIFSQRCSPSQYVGPSRYVDSPCTVDLLPEIHLCFISHDHYDHLDYYTIMDLWKHHKRTIHFIVPMGLKQWFEGCKIPSDRITELDWWNETLVSFGSGSGQSSPNTSSATSSNSGGVDPEAALNLKVAFTPAQHRSGRGLMDHMKTLWGSWCVGVVESKDACKAAQRGMKDWDGFKMFFGGDTGYRYATAPESDNDAICPAFRDIANLYSPFTFALLPLSTGSSLPFLRSLLSLSLDQYTLTSSQHCDPADSMEIHRLMGCERTLGMHWGTFCDADEARGTRVEFGRIRREKGVGKKWEGDGPGEGGEGKGRFVVADIGETLVFP